MAIVLRLVSAQQGIISQSHRKLYNCILHDALPMTYLMFPGLVSCALSAIPIIFFPFNLLVLEESLLCATPTPVFF